MIPIVQANIVEAFNNAGIGYSSIKWGHAFREQGHWNRASDIQMIPASEDFQISYFVTLVISFLIMLLK